MNKISNQLQCTLSQCKCSGKGIFPKHLSNLRQHGFVFNGSDILSPKKIFFPEIFPYHIFPMDFSINLLFSLPGMVNCSFLSPNYTPLFFQFTRIILMEQGIQEPSFSLWSKITFPLKLLYLKASSKLLTNFLFSFPL